MQGERKITAASIDSETRMVAYSPDVQGTVAIFARLVASRSYVKLSFHLEDGDTVEVETEEGYFSVDTHQK
jgi:hypothetical protein